MVQGIGLPVVDIDEIQIVARPDNPAEQRLPPESAALTVVLDVVYQRHLRIQLRLGHEPVEIGGKGSFGEPDTVPFPGDREQKPRPRTDVDLESQLTAVARVEVD